VRWHDLLAGLDVRERVSDSDVEVTSITEDSRRVVPGACFAARTGDAFDGHDHARDAVAAGAVALLVERRLPLSVPQARVESVLRTLGPAAARLYGEPSRAVRCLGVTGTAGKTTTTMLLASIARAAGEMTGLIGSDGVFVDGDRILLGSHDETLYCLDKDGKKLWEHDFEIECHASPSLAGNRLYLFGQKGTSIITEAGREFKELFRAEIPDVFHASPAFAENRIILRGTTNLWGLANSPKEHAAK
jgi:hypothetical protein